MLLSCVNGELHCRVNVRLSVWSASRIVESLPLTKLAHDGFLQLHSADIMWLSG